MPVTKLRFRSADGGLAPAGHYFKRVAEALRAANEEAGFTHHAPRLTHRTDRNQPTF